MRTRRSATVRTAAAFAGALAAALVILTAAGALGQTEASSKDQKSVLTVGLTYDLYTSNPFRACGCGAEYEWLALNYDMLVRFDPKTLGPAPGLAEELPTRENGGISADGTTYTFKIRKGVTWSDGQPVTARDVAFTYQFVIDNRMGAYDNYLPFDPTFETPDDYTLVWHMSEPSLAPLYPPWIPILPEHVWSAFDGDPKGAKAFENIPAIGSGPFRLVEWKQGQYWRMEANPDYWGGAPKVDEIVFRSFDNQEAMALALREGEVDLVSGLLPTLAQSLEGQPNVKIHEAAGRGFMNLAFNFGGQGPKATNHPALQDLTVRQAIAHAIDKQALVDRVLLGKGHVGAGLMPPTSPWYWEPAADEAYAFDPALARQMLDDAGYVDTDDDGIREMPGGGEPLELEILAASSVPSAPPSARLIGAWLRDIGIAAKIKPVGDGAIGQAWGDGSFDAYLWGWNPDPDPDFILSVFTTAQCGGWSDGCYSDPEYDRMYEQQQVTSDPEERRATIDRMEQHVYDNAAELVLYYESDLEGYRTDTFTGYAPTPPPNGYMVFGYLPYPYMNIRPVTAASGAARAPSSSFPLWVWGAGLVVVVGLIALGLRAARRREDDVA
jgi:ABC-type transport system substrate-binding protein